MDRAEQAEDEVRRLTHRIRELELAASQPAPSSARSTHGADAPPGFGGAAVAAAAAAPTGAAVAAARPRQSADSEVLALNVSGREVWALRSTLLLVEGSRLQAMFGAGDGEAPPCDVWGRPFL